MNANQHDTAGIGVTIGIALATQHPAIIAGSLAGFLWLSPDVDLPHSRPSRRWGPLKAIWAPLQATTQHRGITHVPVVGALVMMAYLAVPVAAIAILSGHVGMLGAIAPLSIPFAFGVVVQQLTHLALDRI